ncbi:DUF1190 domain-containing protein [Entomomonas moraniae]|uniref:DUF1190 domain-containing protein n=1 Tax=Entomomonas moraniae TaxID=2213226 RepID=A0A3Q9JHK4_9GAMM|nr:DUF1190 domain-containing protein [Entomomonas moraniae]AZS49715.1 DUF1190 domain-containing protein [Entomomonas moraniae]
MKRSKAVQLLLISATPFYLTACNQQEHNLKTVTEVKNYKDLQDCLDDKQNPLVCSKAYTAVKDLEKKNPLIYDSKENCLKDFDDDLCVDDTNSTSSGSTTHRTYARSSGFQLSSTREIVVDKQGNTIDPVVDDYARSIAQKESQYIVEPLYKPREGRSPTNLSAATESSGIHASSTGSTSHVVGAAVTGAAAGYMANKMMANKDSSFSFTERAQNQPSVKRYGSGGAYKNSSSSSKTYRSSSSSYRSGFSRSYSRSYFGG